MSVQKYEGGPEMVQDSAFAGIDNGTLIEKYYEEDLNPVIGVDLAIRLIKHAGFKGDPTTTPLMGRGGPIVGKNGQPLMLQDYVNFAAEHHEEALEQILDFLDTEPGSEEHNAAKQAYSRFWG